MPPKVQGKRTYTKIEVVNNARILEFAKAAKEAGEQPFDVDLDGENQSAGMKEHEVRYLKLTIRKPDGKYIQFSRDSEPFKTASGPQIAKVDAGKNPNAVSLQERIIVPDDSKTLEEHVDEYIASMELDLTEKKLAKERKRTLAYAKDCMEQWQVERLIDGEFNRMMNDKAYRAKIGWKKKSDHKIQGNIQYYRDIGKEEPEDEYEADPLYNPDVKKVQLKYPIVRHRIKIDAKTGKPYKRILEINDSKPEPFLAMVVNSEGSKEELTCYTIPDWLNMNSIVLANETYQVCLHGKGAALHASLDELNVKLGEPLRTRPKVDKAKVDRVKQMRTADSDDEDAKTEDSVRQSVVDRMKKVSLNQDDQRDELGSDSDPEDEPKEEKEESKEAPKEKRKRSSKKASKEAEPDSD